MTRKTPISDQAKALILAGAVGLVLSFGLALSLFLSVFNRADFAALVIYFLGVVGMILVTSGGGRTPLLWAIRLVVPIPLALLARFGLNVLGL